MTEVGRQASAAVPAFQLSRACKRYASNEGVGPIDLQIAEGSTTVLLGTSGAGKSTLLKLLNGLVVPDSGEVLFRGQPLSLQSRLRMGYVVQGGGLFPHLTAADNVTLVARWLRQEKKRIDARLHELAALVRLPFESLQRFPVQLSGGQSQRVGLMRALMLDAPVLLLDEPLGALDPLTRFDLQNDLREVFQRLGKTVAIVTHDLSEAAFFGGTVLLFQAGHVVQKGSIDELVKNPATPFVERFVQAQRGVS
jgi:osmoprotectant transport system ATP-binding protein